jgi:hypothetical protein
MNSDSSSSFTVSGNCNVMQRLIETLQSISPNVEITQHALQISEKTLRQHGLECFGAIKIPWQDFMPLESIANWYESPEEQITLGAITESLSITPALNEHLLYLQRLLASAFAELRIHCEPGKNAELELLNHHSASLDIFRKVMRVPCKQITVNRRLVWNSRSISSITREFSKPFSYAKNSNKYRDIQNFERARRDFYNNISHRLESKADLVEFLTADCWREFSTIVGKNSSPYSGSSEFSEWTLDFVFPNWGLNADQLVRALTLLGDLSNKVYFYSPAEGYLQHWMSGFQRDSVFYSAASVDMSFASKNLRDTISHICTSSPLLLFLLLGVVGVKVHLGTPLFYMPEKVFLEELMMRVFAAPGTVSTVKITTENEIATTPSESEDFTQGSKKQISIKHWGLSEARALWER